MAMVEEDQHVTPQASLALARSLIAPRSLTMAGVDISRVGGTLSIHKTGAASKAQPKAKPVARAAEILVCRSLGIVKDGEDVATAALEAFVKHFKNELSPEMITAMRGLFKLDDGSTKAVEDALLLHGGGGALDTERPGEDPEPQQART